MRRVAVFVDAGYLWVQLSHIVHGSTFAQGKMPGRSSITIDFPRMREGLIAQVTAQFPTINLLRIYWYDGPGPHGKTPGHNSIEELDDIKLRLGTRNGVGDQKAVDGLIIADIIAMAQSKAISDALLISGDADLTPGVAAAQGLGIRVHLLTMGPSNSTSPFLRAEVDCKAHWDDTEVKKFASASAPAHNGSTQSVPLQSLSSAHAVQSAVTIPEWMNEAATLVLSTIETGRLFSLSKSGAVPKEIDIQLLREGCKKSGLSSLDETQKRTLRATFRSKIPVAKPQ